MSCAKVSKHLPLILAVLFCVVAPRPVAAITIDFTQITIDPTATWTLDGLTITATADYSGSVESVIGEGIHIDSIDGLFGLNMYVDGRINSFTILPYMTIDGVESTDFGFEFGYKPVVPGWVNGYGYQYVMPPFNPITIDLTGDPGHLDEQPTYIWGLGLFSDFGQIPIYMYREAHPDAVIEYGFWIQSLDYIPTQVPEPSSLTLMSFGALALHVARRFFVGRVQNSV